MESTKETKKTIEPDSAFWVTSFYFFLNHPNLVHIENTLENSKRLCRRLGLRGHMILAHEGVNCTMSGSKNSILEFKSTMEEWFSLKIYFKDSISTKKPFRRLKVEIRDEIVTSMSSQLNPKENKNYLSPHEWQRELQESRDVFLLDTRNDYEVKLGKFRGAHNPRITQFSDLPTAVKELRLEQDQKILMYCTGGIRCEKASLELNKLGFKKVYQLEGGILNYLKHFPREEFEGECFVFDHRVSLDQDLNPSAQFSLCPFCGDPTDQRIQCVRCGDAAKVCPNCQNSQLESGITCSKNCHHLWQRSPGTTGRHQALQFDQGLGPL